MRKLKLADIRVAKYDEFKVIAAPLWAYELGPYLRGRYHRIDEVWMPVRNHFRRKAKEQNARTDATLEHHRKIINDPNANPTEREIARVWLHSYFTAEAISKQPHRPTASLYYPSFRAIEICRTCGEEFFALGNTTTCTDECAKKRRDATRTRGNYQRKPAVHEARDCPVCNATFIPRRKDARYCSVRCRVAAHRAKNQQ